MSGRVLRRPIGGWGARQWRRGVLAWLEAAFLFLCAAGTFQLGLKILDLIFS